MAELQKESTAGLTTRRRRRKTLAPGRVVRAFGYALKGLKGAWQREGNFRIEVTLGMLAVALAGALRVSPVPIILASALVLALELINSALEATIDLSTSETHPLAEYAKDTSAAAVLIAALGALLVGLWVLGPPLWQRLVVG